MLSNSIIYYIVSSPALLLRLARNIAREPEKESRR